MPLTASIRWKCSFGEILTVRCFRNFDSSNVISVHTNEQKSGRVSCKVISFQTNTQMSVQKWNSSKIKCGFYGRIRIDMFNRQGNKFKNYLSISFAKDNGKQKTFDDAPEGRTRSDAV
ncbi:hypothetical protein NPIL_454321 [Nephila pilipes]|uniref:Uncharacterized protein n=1 Tax=Nephila pilipes TaxID=299642 RepID=A0A8X6NYU6_NEPPI|nr:hypothetical protein NPIL_454321 [Nephila pilipes]